MSESSSAVPISPARFAAALKDLPLSSLHLKAAELRNSIAHLDYSNEQLLPFAEGRDPSSTSSSTASETAPGVPDQDCIDAIRENEIVIARMQERIELLKREVEGRGQVWVEGGLDDRAVEEVKEGELVNGMGEAGSGSGSGSGNGSASARASSSPWTDGTFQTGRIVNGEVRMDDSTATTATTGDRNTEPSGIHNAATSVNATGVNSVNGVSSSSNAAGGGGRLDDEALRRAMEERMRSLGQEDEDEEDGMHL